VSAYSRARLAVILLIAGAVVSALTIPAEIAEILLPELNPDQELAENPAGAVVLLLLLGLSLLTIAIFIATVVAFLMWEHRCANNLRTFGYWASQLTYSPAWAVGSFFIPIVNLFVPYKAMKEIWEKSRPPESVPFSFSNSPPSFFPAWWGFWIACNFASNIYFRMTMGGAPREATAIVGVVSDSLSIAAAGLAIMVIKEITRRQEDTSKHLTLTPTLPPPPPRFEAATTQPSNSATTGA
jgi:heme/copper-type cytochrome/quinol oxidase subunit 2